MKLLGRLEKSKVFWSIFCISLLFFFLRLPSLIEPNWYGDEGIYQIIGMAMNHNSMLYSQIWDNKPPLLYIIYAIFNGDQFGTRLASLIFGLMSIWLFFYLSQKLFENLKSSITSTILFTLLFATPLIEGNIANAENFMLLPIIAAAIFIYNVNEVKQKSQNAKLLILSGILLGIAFLFKIVAIFDLAAFLCFILIINLPKKSTIPSLKELKSSHEFSSTYFLLLGFLSPIIITTAYFLINNAIGDFIRATFFGNIAYVGYANKFIIPQGLLILKLFLLGGFVIFITTKRHKLSKSAIFVLIWTAFSIFNALFSQRPYTHYLLVLLPSFCLLVAATISEKNLQLRKFFLIILIAVLTIPVTNFNLYGFKKTIAYYKNAYSFIMSKKDLYSYQAFFDKKTPRDYQLASFIKSHTNKNDKIFIWGDSAQIYVLSNTFPINKYTVAYHTLKSKETIRETQNDINKVNPKYVIILAEAKGFPFKVNSYVEKYATSRAIIYERAF